MHQMLERDTPEDFIIATGETNTLEDFVATAFSCFGRNWRDHVVLNPTLLRPLDITYSSGDPAKAEQDWAGRQAKRCVTSFPSWSRLSTRGGWGVENNLDEPWRKVPTHSALRSSQQRSRASGAHWAILRMQRRAGARRCQTGSLRTSMRLRRLAGCRGSWCPTISKPASPSCRATSRASIGPTRHDLQTRRGRREELATPRLPQPVAEAHPRCKVRRQKSRSSDRKLKLQNPDAFRHQNSAIAPRRGYSASTNLETTSRIFLLAFQPKSRSAFVG